MFPERLKTIRKEKGLSRSQLAAVIGTSKSSISRWELGTREPRFQMLVKLCDALEVSSDYLLGRTPKASAGEASPSSPDETSIITDEDV